MDGYTDTVSDPARPIDSWTTVDLTISYDTADSGRFLTDTLISLTTQNLFDEDPPFVNNLGLSYDLTNSNGLGRFLAVQVSKRW
jgi:outer membrane receptor protein involved in Fe transport